MRAVFVVGTIGFLSVTAVHTLRDRMRPLPDTLPAGLPLATPPVAQSVAGVALQAGRGGHFFVTAQVDGRAVPMMVDTGATTCAFSEEDAARIGIRVGPGDFTSETRTANGTIRVAPIRIGRLQIGSVTVRDVEAVVIPRGRLSTSLLGMSFLSRLRDFSITGATLTLRG